MDYENTFEPYNRAVEPSIDNEDNEYLKTHERIHEIYKEKNYIFVLNPKGYRKDYQKYISSEKSVLGFDERIINKNDFLIFDSINQSLIFYALKFDISFIVYSTSIPICYRKIKRFCELSRGKEKIVFFEIFKKCLLNTNFS